MPTERTVKVRVDADISPFARRMAEASAEAKAFASGLQEADGRMANLVQTGLALAPALVPLGAAAVPAIAGLSMQLGLAATAAGTAVLAFQGVGDAVKAIDAYKLDPTVENFQKMQQALDKLGPAGQEFAVFIDGLRPKLQELQDIAQQGLLPGVEDSIKHLLTLLPEAKNIIAAVSSEMGNLAEQGGKALTSDRWRAFLQMLDREAAPILQDMGQTLGHFVSGLAAIITDFTPMANSFSGGLLHMSEAFDKWAQGLGKTQGFQDFVDYVQKSGPRALDALEAIGKALVSLVEAAAPVGQAVLPIITTLADALAAVANSPAGPAIISVAAAIGVLGRSLAVLKAVGLTGENQSFLGKQFNKSAIAPVEDAITTTRDLTAATAELSAAESEAALAHAKYIGQLRASSARVELLGATKATEGMTQAADNLVAANTRQREAALKVGAATEKQGAAMSRFASTAGKAAALGGAFALASSGMADKVGLANTANFAMVGMLAGPWGAAVGAGVGLVSDLASANNDLENAIKRADAAASSQVIDLGAQRQALADLTKTSDDYSKKVNSTGLGAFQDQSALDRLKGAWTSLSDVFTHSSEEGQKAAAQQRQNFEELRTSLLDLYAAANQGGPRALKATDDELTNFAANAAPAFQAAGYSVKEALKNLSFGEQVSIIKDYNSAMDSATGQSQAVGVALGKIGSEMESTATAADGLKSALDALFGVQLSQSEADDQWIRSLHDLRSEIAQTNGAIKGNSDAALSNRDAIRTSVQNLSAKIAADAAAGVSGDKLTASLLKGRDAIIRQAVAAGASKKDIRAYLDQLNLTPKSLATIITTPGLLNAKDQVKALGRLYGLTPKEVRTLMSQPGMAAAKSEIDALAKKYNLTPKQVRTLIKAVDQASSIAGRIKSIYDGLPRYIKTQIITQHTDKFTRITGGPDGAGADGATVHGPRYPYGDKMLYMLAPGEEVISNRYGQADKHRALLKAINSNRLADGGTAGNRFTASERRSVLGDFSIARDMDTKAVRDELDQFRKAIRSAGGDWTARLDHMGDRLLAVSKSIDDERAAIDKTKSSLQDLRSSASQFRGTVAGNFMHGLFGTQITGSSLVQGYDQMTDEQRAAIDAQVAKMSQAELIQSQLNADAFQSAQFGDLLKRLKHKGLSTGLFRELAASGDVSSAQALAGLSRGQIRELDRQYASRAQSAADLGRYASQAGYGRQIAEQTAELKKLRAEVRQLTDTRKGIALNADSIIRVGRAVGDETGKAVNGAAAAGHRRRNG